MIYLRGRKRARHRRLVVFLMCGAFLVSPGPAMPGTFIFKSVSVDSDFIVHPIGYTGNETNQVVTVTFGIRPGTMFSNEMRFALLNATQTWTALQPTTGNLDFNSNLPGGGRQILKRYCFTKWVTRWGLTTPI